MIVLPLGLGDLWTSPDSWVGSLQIAQLVVKLGGLAPQQVTSCGYLFWCCCCCSCCISSWTILLDSSWRGRERDWKRLYCKVLHCCYWKNFPTVVIDSWVNLSHSSNISYFPITVWILPHLVLVVLACNWRFYDLCLIIVLLWWILLEYAPENRFMIFWAKLFWSYSCFFLSPHSHFWHSLWLIMAETFEQFSRL